MQKIKQFILSSTVTLMVMLGAGAATAVPVFAQTPQQQVCTAINGNNACNTPSGPTLSSVIKTVLSILSIIVGIAAIIMIIIGGLKYVTSGGDASSISSAKNTIIYALVGLIVAAMAQFFARFVIHAVQ